MKAYIICKQNETGHGVTFECSNCKRHIFVNTLCKKNKCDRCDRTFKNLIKIEKVKIV
jgi:hypothetical protein